jgi:protein-tyrosine phosphatase
VTKADYRAYDYLLCADAANIRNTIRITGADTEDKIRLLLDYAVGESRQGKSITDPWYSGRFDETYRDVVTGCAAFLEFLETEGIIHK